VGGTLVSGSVDWAASLRARFGYVSGLWLFYGTAGVGWERVNLSLQSALNGAFNGSRRYARSLISNSADASHPAQAS
jgi:opacity protein-like surface antigen